MHIEDAKFNQIIRDPEIFHDLLALILPKEEIMEIEYREVPEGAYGADTYGVWVKAHRPNGQSDMYVSMRMGTLPNLPLLARVIYALMDKEDITNGTFYNGDLRPEHVILFCPKAFEEFIKDRYVYNVHSAWIHNPEKEVGDKQYTHYYNIDGEIGDVSEEIKEVLRFIGDPQGYKASSCDLVSRMHRAYQRI